MRARAGDKAVEGIFQGDGIILDGFLIISPLTGVIYLYKEIAGVPILYNDIIRVIKIALLRR